MEHEALLHIFDSQLSKDCDRTGARLVVCMDGDLSNSASLRKKPFVLDVTRVCNLIDAVHSVTRE